MKKPVFLYPFWSIFWSAAAVFAIGFWPEIANCTSDPKQVPQNANITEYLGGQIDLDLEFLDENSQRISLRSLVSDGKPLIIAPVYFECPRLCTLTQEGLVEALKEVRLNFVDDFRVASVSFDFKETPEFARAKAQKYHALLSERSQQTQGWKFLTGNETIVKALMTQLGFAYAKDEAEFMHAAVLMVVTPTGKISRYLYGIRFSPRDLRLALIEAADGKIGSVMNRVLMFCFRYDHIQGRYTVAIMNIVRVVCSLIAVVLLTCLFWMRMKERRRQPNC